MPQNGSVKSASVDKKATASKLVKGNTLHPVLVNDKKKYVFKISSSLEKLYYYKLDPHTNKEVEIVVYKQVRNGDRETFASGRMDLTKMIGIHTRYQNKRYIIYRMIIDDYPCGYKLCTEENESEVMYFAFERYEKKGS